MSAYLVVISNRNVSAEIEKALSDTPAEGQADIKAAQHNIRRFAEQQRATMHDLTWEDPEQPGAG